MIMNIEKTISEQAVSDILTPMLESQDRIVTEDVAPLFDQATGLDTPPASGTVTTTIEESRSVITAIIRTAWTATLTMLGGASVLSYIAAAYTYLRTRLQGNETYGIPDRRSEISASSPLAANLALLNDRKIGGVPEAEDGISLVHLLADPSTITELTDDNTGWKYNGVFSKIRSLFPSASKFTLNCVDIEFTNDMGWTQGLTGVSDLQLPYLKNMWNHGGSYNGIGFCGAGYERIYLPSFENYRCDQHGSIFSDPKVKYIDAPKLGYFSPGYSGNVVRGCSELLELNIPAFDWSYNYAPYYCIINSCPKIRKLAIGQCALGLVISGATDDLIHVEIKEGYSISLPMGTWNPTNALDASRTDLIEEGSTAQNNLQQFLENFRDYIANRLTDNGSGLTLTLSQAVRNAIHAAESTYGIENIIITQKGWTISPAPN